MARIIYVDADDSLFLAKINRFKSNAHHTDIRSLSHSHDLFFAALVKVRLCS